MGSKKKLKSKVKSGAGKVGKALANPYLNFAIAVLESLPALAQGGSVKKKSVSGRKGSVGYTQRWKMARQRRS